MLELKPTICVYECKIDRTGIFHCLNTSHRFVHVHLYYVKQNTVATCVVSFMHRIGV